MDPSTFVSSFGLIFLAAGIFVVFPASKTAPLPLTNRKSVCAAPGLGLDGSVNTGMIVRLQV